MTYPVMGKNHSPTAKWDKKILVFNQKEMKNIIDNVKTKSGKPDRFFSFDFTASDKNTRVVGGRGFEQKIDFSKNLLENKLTELRKKVS